MNFADQFAPEAAALRRARRWDEVQIKKFDLAGGKTWFNLLIGRSVADVEAIVAKNCEGVIARLEAKPEGKGAKS